LWLAALAPGHAQAPAGISGTIVNGTAGASVPGGLTVTATEVDARVTKQVATKRASVGPGGAFRIDGFPGQAGDHFVVGTDYLGVTYSAEATPGSPATLKIYETTTDPTVLSIPATTLTVIIGRQGNYNVLQLLTAHNSSDRSYVGTPNPAAPGPPPTLELPIPAGATAFSPVQGLANGLTAAPDGLVASTDSIQPGNTDVSYIYNIAVPRSGWGMSLPVIYATSKFDVLVDPGLTLSGPGLAFRKVVTINKKDYRDYQGANLAPGTTLNATIAPASSTSATLYLGLGALLVLIVASAVGVPRLLRRRRKEGPQAGEPEPAGEREQLIEEIAALDEAHAAGSVEDDDYTAQRAELKNRLLAQTGTEKRRLEGRLGDT
jgi:membrane protein implicated in regulation of membrane protease activity